MTAMRCFSIGHMNQLYARPGSDCDGRLHLAFQILATHIDLSTSHTIQLSLAIPRCVGTTVYWQWSFRHYQERKLQVLHSSKALLPGLLAYGLVS